MPDTPAQSPDFLPRHPKRGAGVRGSNKVPLIIAGIAIAAVVGAIGYTYQLRANEQNDTDKTQDHTQAEPASASTVLDKAPAAGIIESTQKQGASVTPIVPAIPTDGSTATTQPISTTTQRIATTQPQAMNWAVQERSQRRIAEAEKRNAAFEAASTVYVKNQANAANAQNGTVEPGKALSGQIALQQAATHYLPGTRQEALSSYEIKAGTILPSVMIGGVNSDLQGQLVAAITENVYDTATGRYLLIPQGAKLVGTYEHQVIMGQSRVLIIWNRIIYPDASSVDLGAMPGADQAGYSGFRDKTNNHLARTYGNAIVLSLISAAAQLSQPVQRQGDASYSSQQIVASSLGLQLNQLGMQTLTRGMNVSPTLEIRPGYRFNVMITKDILLHPWGMTASAENRETDW